MEKQSTNCTVVQYFIAKPGKMGEFEAHCESLIQAGADTDGCLSTEINFSGSTACIRQEFESASALLRHAYWTGHLNGRSRDFAVIERFEIQGPRWELATLEEHFNDDNPFYRYTDWKPDPRAVE